MSHNIKVRPDFYSQLGLENFAPVVEVSKKYRALAMQLHPDKGGSNLAMQNLNYVHEVLTKHKDAYDNWLHHFLRPRQQMRVVSVVWNGAGFNYYQSTSTTGYTSTTSGGF